MVCCMNSLNNIHRRVFDILYVRLQENKNSTVWYEYWLRRYRALAWCQVWAPCWVLIPAERHHDNNELAKHLRLLTRKSQGLGKLYKCFLPQRPNWWVTTCQDAKMVSKSKAKSIYKSQSLQTPFLLEKQKKIKKMSQTANGLLKTN